MATDIKQRMLKLERDVEAKHLEREKDLMERLAALKSKALLKWETPYTTLRRCNFESLQKEVEKQDAIVKWKRNARMICEFNSISFNAEDKIGVFSHNGFHKATVRVSS